MKIGLLSVSLCSWIVSVSAAHAANSSLQANFDCSSQLHQVISAATNKYRGLFFYPIYAESGAGKAIVLLPKRDCMRQDEIICTEDDNTVKILSTGGASALPMDGLIVQFVGRADVIRLQVVGEAQTTLFMEYRKSELKAKGSQWFSESGVLSTGLQPSDVRGAYKEEHFRKVRSQALTNGELADAIPHWEQLLKIPLEEIPRIILSEVLKYRKFEGQQAKSLTSLKEEKIPQDMKEIEAAQRQLADVNGILDELGALKGKPHEPSHLIQMEADYKEKKVAVIKSLLEKQTRLDSDLRWQKQAELDLEKRRTQIGGLKKAVEAIRQRALLAVQSCAQIPSLQEAAREAQKQLEDN